MNWYKRYIGDYARDTGHLTMLEHGAYTLCLDAFYATAKPLPRDRQRLCRLLRIESQSERRAVLKVLTEFWTETPDGWTNKRGNREILRAKRQASVNQDIASRRKKPDQRDLLSHHEPSYEPSHEPINEPSHEPLHDSSTNPDTRYQRPEYRAQKRPGGAIQSTQTSPPPEAAPPPLISPRLCPLSAHHAWCEGRCHVPRALYVEFQRLAPAEFDLPVWFAEVDTAFAGTAVGDDMFDFWRARWKEKWGTTTQTDKVLREVEQKANQAASLKAWAKKTKAAGMPPPGETP